MLTSKMKSAPKISEVVLVNVSQQAKNAPTVFLGCKMGKCKSTSLLRLSVE